jgi:hypothetical protein
MNTERVNRTTPEWREAKRFEEDGLAVIVEMQDGFRPRYSLRIAQVRGGKVLPFLPVEVRGSFQITLKPLAGPIHALLLKAEEWIQTEAGSRVNEDIDRRIERETKQVNKDRPQTRTTGKTAKRKARLAAKSAAV